MGSLHIWQIVILAFVQGAAELLPVSSSAHVIVAEKLLGLDPTSPQMTLLLVMLHTGTMFAVIVYFWRSWLSAYFSSVAAFRVSALNILSATAATGVVGVMLLHLIKHIVAKDRPDFEIEQLFGEPKLMAVALTAAGLLIIISSRLRSGNSQVTRLQSVLIGAMQGLCLPFRGFSRSGATISTALALGVNRRNAEEFSFALAVILTPAVILKEVYRLYTSHDALAGNPQIFWSLLGVSLLGMCLSFIAGLAALRWLSHWLEQGRWHFFGAYCLFAALMVLWIG